MTLSLGMLLVSLAVTGTPRSVLPHVGHSGSAAPRSVHGDVLRTAKQPVPSRGSEASLGKGRFLVASRDLRDPRFVHTVVLLVEYGPTGALGLIVNRPTPFTLAEALPQLKELAARRDTLYSGGPVVPGGILLLIRSKETVPGTKKVFGRVHVSGSLEVLEGLAARPDDQFRAYAGHAGWAPGQLEAEVEAGGWHVLPADERSIFDKDPTRVWPDLIERTVGAWAQYPAVRPPALRDAARF